MKTFIVEREVTYKQKIQIKALTLAQAIDAAETADDRFWNYKHEETKNIITKL